MNRIDLSRRGNGPMISRHIYGHFSEHLGRCIYDGIFVGKNSPIPNENGMRKDVVAAMRRIHLPVLRWPGGCFADEYHWRDGIGIHRKRMVNTHWGGVVEDNSFGTHEFMELCRQVGCEPYINGNMGSGTVQEMSEWVEYLNSDSDSTVVQERWANGSKAPFDVKYFGIGNENWGCGGNMRAEYYADEYRQYQTYCRNYGDNHLYRIACGPSNDDTHWTEVLMERAGKYMDGLSMHYYTVPGDTWADKGSATDFDETRYLTTLKKAQDMDRIIALHSAIMDRHDPDGRVGLLVDEWGCWHNVEPGTNPGFLYQQNTMRDAMVAALTLNIFNRHAKRVHMANIAQTVNVLQAILLTEGDQMALTPTYHVFDLYQPHMDATLVDTLVTSKQLDKGMDQLSVSASEKDGQLTVTIANLSATEEAPISLRDVPGTCASARMIHGDIHAHNTFERPEQVTVQPLAGVQVEGTTAMLTLPPCAVASLTFHG